MHHSWDKIFRLKRRKVLIYVKDIHGGTGRFIESLVTLAQRDKRYFKNIDFKIVSNVDGRSLNLRIKKLSTNLTIHKSLSISGVFKSLFNFIELYKLACQYKPDVIFSLDIYANITILILNLFLKKKAKLITSTHINLTEYIESRTSSLFSYISTLAIKKLYNFSDIHLAPSVELKKQLVNTYKIDSNKITSIPYPVDVKKIKYLSKTLQGNHKDIKRKTNILNILSMGRFEAQKGFDMLLESISEIKAHFPKELERIHIYILGKGKQKEKYKEFIKNNHLNDKVTLLKWTNNPFPILKMADIFVFVSNYECFPNVLLEAQALSVPTISSDVDFGPREILDYGQYGVLLKDRSASEIMRNIIKLSKNGILRKEMKLNSISAINRYSWRTLRSEYRRLLYSSK
ncbi:MAG: glycosyltransferase [Microgenomates group bacterium]